MRSRGMTLIDVVVGVAIMSLIFIAIFGAFRISIELVYSTKAKTGAVSLMTEQLEYIRSLPYAAVGTVGGIPTGNIPQLNQVSLNGITYTVRTLIQYIDAPEDGLDDNDENLITADYKTVKVEVLWSVKESARSTYAVTRVSPPGEETLEDGGTLKVNVYDAAINPLPGAYVRIVNPNTTPAVDVSVTSNENGVASFPGAPEAGGYEITVGGTNNYSTAQTYDDTAQNPNPSPAHIAVVDEQITSITFFIDMLGSLRFSTFEPIGLSSFNDTFSNQSKLVATTSTTVLGGALVLDEASEGVYETIGTAISETVSPALLASWGSLDISSTIPADTSLVVQVYYYDGSAFTLIDNDTLPGNATGFSSGSINVGVLPIGTYNTLQLRAALSTADTAATPELLDWSLSYNAGPTPLPNVSFDIVGTKTIGSNGGVPVYKYSDSFTTDSSAEWFIDDVEWDTYTVTLTDAYDIAERCPNDITVAPGIELEPYYYLAPDTAHSLRVYVASGGIPVQDASVSISGVSGSLTTSVCGQVYSGGLSENDYTITISKTGFANAEETVSVSGDTVLLVGLTAL